MKKDFGPLVSSSSSMAIALSLFQLMLPSLQNKLSFRDSKFKLSNSPPQNLPRGVKNYGNTCFLNAILQGLAYCDILTSTIHEKQRMIYELQQLQMKLDLKVFYFPPNQQLINCLEKCFWYLRNKDSAATTNYPGNNKSVKTLDDYVQLLLQLFPSFSNTTLTYGKQEDAHEFYINIILAFQQADLHFQSLIETFQNAFPLSIISSSSTTASLLTTLQSIPSIASLFQGTSLSTIYCLECHKLSQRKDSFIDLQLNIQSKSSLLDCLEDHFR